MNEESQVRGCFSITFICASQVGFSPTKPGAAIRMRSDAEITNVFKNQNQGTL